MADMEVPLLFEKPPLDEPIPGQIVKKAKLIEKPEVPTVNPLTERAFSDRRWQQSDSMLGIGVEVTTTSSRSARGCRRGKPGA